MVKSGFNWSRLSATTNAARPHIAGLALEGNTTYNTLPFAEGKQNSALALPTMGARGVTVSTSILQTALRPLAEAVAPLLTLPIQKRKNKNKELPGGLLQPKVQVFFDPQGENGFDPQELFSTHCWISSWQLRLPGLSPHSLP